MAVQNHLLSNTILIRPDDNDDSDSSLQGETMKVQVNTPLYFCVFCLVVNRGSYKFCDVFTWQNVLVAYKYTAIFIISQLCVLHFYHYFKVHMVDPKVLGSVT